MSSCEFRLKRVYGERSRSDGFRVLVDRVWPRGVSGEEAAFDLWLKDIAPSADLRKWFGHDPKRWDGFVKKYRTELDRNEEAVDQMLELAKEHPVVTLLFGAKDEEHNQAVALRDYLQERRG